VLRFNPAGGLKFLAEHALGYKPKFHFKDVEPPTSWRPYELGYAPTALAVSSKEKNWEVWGVKKGKPKLADEPTSDVGADLADEHDDDAPTPKTDPNAKLLGIAWPGVIRQHIEHWATRAERPRIRQRRHRLYTGLGQALWQPRAERRRFGAGLHGAGRPLARVQDQSARRGRVVARRRASGRQQPRQHQQAGRGSRLRLRCDGRRGGGDPRREHEEEQSRSHPGLGDCRRRAVQQVSRQRSELRPLRRGWRLEAWEASGRRPLEDDPEHQVCREGSGAIHEAVGGRQVSRQLRGHWCVVFPHVRGGRLESARHQAHEGSPTHVPAGVGRDGPPCGGDFDSFEVTLADAVYNDPALRRELLSKVPCHKCGATGRKPCKKCAKAYKHVHPDCPECGQGQLGDCDECEGTGQTRKKIHALFGTALSGLSYNEVMASAGTDNDWYDKGKRGVFAMIYGGDWNTLVQKLGVTAERAKAAYDKFCADYPGVFKARQKTFNAFCSMKQPAGLGSAVIWEDPSDFAITFLGFKRYFTLENKICKALFDLARNIPKHWKACKVKVVRRDRVQTAGGAVASALYGAAFQMQAANMRAAANHEIQSPGAQITKRVQRRIWDLQPVGIAPLQIAILNVHDELMTVAAPPVVTGITQVVRETVESFRPQVPLIGMTWFEGMENWAEKKGGAAPVRIRSKRDGDGRLMGRIKRPKHGPEWYIQRDLICLPQDSRLARRAHARQLVSDRVPRPVRDARQVGTALDRLQAAEEVHVHKGTKDQVAAVGSQGYAHLDSHGRYTRGV
jgi:hypothetical protein